MNKYLIVLPSDLMGGAEANLLKIARFLSMRNKAVKIVFLSRRAKGASIWNELKGVDLVYMNARRESVGALMFFLYLFPNYHCSTVICSHTHTNAYVSLLSRIKILNAKQIVLRESTNVFSWFSGWKLKLIKALYCFYHPKSHVICQTERMKSELLFNLPKFLHHDLSVVSNPVDMNDVIEKSSMKSDLIEEKVPVFDASYKVIVTVARLVEEKAIDVLIDSFSRLDDDFALVVLGDGPQKKALLDFAQKLGCAERVFFLGYISNPYPFVKRADLSVVSSRLEGFPNTLLEKMCLSRRVVSTLCADGVETIPGIRVCNPDDVVGLEKAIKDSFEEPLLESHQRQKAMLSYVQGRTVDKFVNNILKEHF
ncbi:glycosyltransferase [Vibrio sp. LaRot3]|uniref:glycosyltransferase n=1 Tax=Vibrio sp. LaRot3 TaxID=2998829 RepID=UPI0022CE09E1|nr:glycosyltransferase [Vibrio sp. LaRot3]MDA0149401.1 glycosyltransferase [Vibrio sp. LaRot3]